MDGSKEAQPWRQSNALLHHVRGPRKIRQVVSSGEQGDAWLWEALEDPGKFLLVKDRSMVGQGPPSVDDVPGRFLQSACRNTLMKFTKMHGLGNDYVYVETFYQPAPTDPVRLALSVSDRHFGIGSDGLILIMPSDRADARMRMFNADGSEGEMCGNGIRCVAKFLYDHGLARKDRVTVETGRGVLSLDLEIAGGKVKRVRVDMGTPILKSADIPTLLPGDPPINVPIQVDDLTLAGTAVSMGNPHVVIYLDSVQSFPLELLGPALERHEAFPRRVNVHIVEVVSRGEVRMRTWERGSGVTLACGTGACAVCVAGVLSGRTEPRILAHLPGGDLELDWPDRHGPVFMTGPATEVFSGEWGGE